MARSTARLEQLIDNAHRNLYWAKQEADAVGNFGVEQDLEQLLVELTRVGTSLLGSSGRRGVRPPSRLPRT